MLLDILIWWFLAEILGLISFPLVFRFCRNLPDRGYSISKIMGILLVSYITWMLSIFILDYNLLTILFSSFIVFIFSTYILFHDKIELIKFLKENKRIIFLNEIVFLVFFFLFVTTRMLTPEIKDLEKLADFSFLNGILKSTKIPPLDPWYSGGKIQYYYFGYFITATLTKLSNLPSYITFNLTIGLFYTLLACGLFGIGYNLTKRFSYGLITVLVVAILSNGFGIFQILIFLFPGLSNIFIKTFGLEYPITCCWNPSTPLIEQLTGFPLWPSTRVIPDTINEYPYATFLFADLHPHFMAFPFQILLLFLILNIFMSKEKGFKLFGDKSIPIIINIFVFSVCLGSLYFLNTWDYPVYVLLFISALSVQQFREFGKFNFKNSLKIIPLLIIPIFISFALYIPYYFSSKTSYPIGFVNQTTGLHYLLIIFGLPIFLILSFLVYNFKKTFKKREKNYLLLVFIGSIFISFLFNFSILALLLPLLYLSLLSLLKTYKADNSQAFIFILIILGSLILIMCDFLYLDWRLNTVFKMYFHTWFMFGIAGSYSLYFLRQNVLKKTSKKIYSIWLIVFFALIIITSICTVFVTQEHMIRGINGYIGLDGLEYMKTMEEGDYHAIMWLIKNVKDSPVILEMPGESFRWWSRVSSNTGLPTIIGWEGHEKHWRLEDKEIDKRVSDANTIFETTNNDEALTLIKKYNVTYIFVGSLEKQKYSEGGLNKFMSYPNYKLAYDDYSVKIFEVI